MDYIIIKDNLIEMQMMHIFIMQQVFTSQLYCILFEPLTTFCIVPFTI